MPQKLSAIKYIKNNKRRTSVLIVSLALCFVLTYLTQVMLLSTEETLGAIFLESTKKIQHVLLSDETLGIGKPGNEETNKERSRKYLELAEKLGQHDGVEKVFPSQLVFCIITPTIGSFGYEVPLVSREEAAELTERMDARLIGGRMAENECEIVLDKASMENNRFELGDYFFKENYGEKYTIVGILDCDTYFGCGIAPSEKAEENTQMLTVISDIDNIAEILAEEGVAIDERYDLVLDHAYGERSLGHETSELIGDATRSIYIGVLLLMSISLIVVYAMYLRDRHNELCLYCSIGYSRKSIYLSILRELLFTFVAALIIGGGIIGLSLLTIDKAIIEPAGLKCRYFHPDTMCEIFCSYALILGILQIPVRYEIYRIRTIDAIDYDLY